ncbi:MAG: hypothetical protein ACT4P7_11030 [Gemmatimonadaceae bacterium]
MADRARQEHKGDTMPLDDRIRMTYAVGGTQYVAVLAGPPVLFADDSAGGRTIAGVCHDLTTAQVRLIQAYVLDQARLGTAAPSPSR